MTKTQEEQLLRAIQKLSREAEGIRRALVGIEKVLAAEKAPTRITFSKDGVVEEKTIPDLETFFERLEDDHK